LNRRDTARLRYAVLAVVIVFLVSRAASAHCDGMDGPVVKAARNALETQDVNLALIWVQKKDEAEIRRAFQETLGVPIFAPAL